MQQYRIIIVDGHPLFRNALKRTLQLSLNNSTLIEADNMAELTKVLDSNPNVDLILLDLSIQGVHGYSGLLDIRGKHPEIRVAVISAIDNYETIHRCMNFGAVGFLSKTLKMEIIQNAVNDILNGNIWVPPIYDLDHFEGGQHY